MKFNVASKSLYSEVSAVSKVISSKNAMSILNNFLFRVEGNMLYVTASDIENTLTAKIEIYDVDGEGAFCADAKKIVDLLKELPDQGIKFDLNDANFSIKITSLNGDFNLIGANGNEYPQTVEAIDASTTIKLELDSKQILKGLENTLFAAGNDEIWPQMMGVFWDIKPDNITFVATDSRKLVKYSDATSAPQVQGSFIMPSKPAAILKGLLNKFEGNAVITVDSKGGTFEIGDYIFNCRFIKGNFPDYNRVIPTSNPFVITVDRQSFLNAVKRVAVFVDQGHGLIKCLIESNEITFKAQDNTLCTSGIEKVACSYEGNRILIGFGATYLIEIFSTLQSTDVELRLSDPSRPGLFVPAENADGTELLMLLMPMNVGDF